MKNQKGYATVLTVVLFSALGLALFAMFNSSQIVTHKLKLQNAVDAATYSTVNVVARELNYKAYTNRAMIANEIAIGQIVAFASWNRQIEEVVGSVQKLAKVLEATGYLAGLGAALEAVASVVENILEEVNEVVVELADLAIMAENATLAALSLSQEAMHNATILIAPTVFNTVLEDNNESSFANDKIVSSIIFPGFLVNEARSFTERSVSLGSSSDMAEYDRFKEVMEASGDGFVFKRSREWLMLNLLVIKIGIGKKGGNEIEMNSGKDAWEWSAMDTVSLWIDDKEKLPIGWGAAHATEDSEYSYGSEKWDQDNVNKFGITLAKNNYADNKVGGESDIQRFHHMKYADSATKKDKQSLKGPSFVAAVMKSKEGVRTINEVVPPPANSSLNIEEEGSLKNNNIFAVAKAEVYFARSYSKNPQDGFEREDKKMEYANIFNPYWQVRLIDYSQIELGLATMAIQ